MECLKKYELTIENIPLYEDNHSEKSQIIEKFLDLFRNNLTIKDTIQWNKKRDQYPFINSRKRTWKTNKIWTFGKNETRRQWLPCMTVG